MWTVEAPKSIAIPFVQSPAFWSVPIGQTNPGGGTVLGKTEESDIKKKMTWLVDRPGKPPAC